MERKNKTNTADLLEQYCNDCGWPIISACCNDEFLAFKDASNWDYWIYCTNKGCKNHDGEGVFQEFPNWVNDLK